MAKVEKQYIDLYAEYHKDPTIYQGDCLEKEIVHIRPLVVEHFATSVLDYGCGKGFQYTQQKLNKEMYLEDDQIFLYDPAYPSHNKLPRRYFDGIISTDVLEHIPKEAIPKVLKYIFRHARKFVYLTICTRPAVAVLPNGENAHCTLEKPDWWENHIIEANKKGIHCEVKWYGDWNDYRVYNKKEKK